MFLWPVLVVAVDTMLALLTECKWSQSSESARDFDGRSRHRYLFCLFRNILWTLPLVFIHLLYDFESIFYSLASDKKTAERTEYHFMISAGMQLH